jgi:hypothetical protein
MCGLVAKKSIAEAAVMDVRTPRAGSTLLRIAAAGICDDLCTLIALA